MQELESKTHYVPSLVKTKENPQRNPSQQSNTHTNIKKRTPNESWLDEKPE